MFFYDAYICHRYFFYNKMFINLNTFSHNTSDNPQKSHFQAISHYRDAILESQCLPQTAKTVPYQVPSEAL